MSEREEDDLLEFEENTEELPESLYWSWVERLEELPESPYWPWVERRYVAELTPDATNDLREMDHGETKSSFRRLFLGEDIRVLWSEGIDVEDRRDPFGGWSSLRVRGHVAIYRPLTNAERHALKRHSDILVNRVIPFPRRLPGHWG